MRAGAWATAGGVAGAAGGVAGEAADGTGVAGAGLVVGAAGAAGLAAAGGVKTWTLLCGAGAGAGGAGVIPGIGELPAGMTGCWVEPVGNTGVAARCGAAGVGTAGVTGATFPAITGEGATPGVVGACGAGAAASGSGVPPSVAGGPVSDMLLCVPM